MKDSTTQYSKGNKMKPTKITGPRAQAPGGKNGRDIWKYPCNDDNLYSVGEIAEMKGWSYSGMHTFIRRHGYKKVDLTVTKSPRRKTKEMCDTDTKDVKPGDMTLLSWTKKARKLDPSEITHSQACRLVKAMINDAKENIVKYTGEDFANTDNGNNKSMWLDESRRFLCNTGGGLESLLACIKGFDTQRALKELRNYALNGYKNSIQG